MGLAELRLHPIEQRLGCRAVDRDVETHATTSPAHALARRLEAHPGAVARGAARRETTDEFGRLEQQIGERLLEPDGCDQREEDPGRRGIARPRLGSFGHLRVSSCTCSTTRTEPECRSCRSPSESDATVLPAAAEPASAARSPAATS